MDFKKYKLGEGKLIYIPNWADDADMLYREGQKLPFTPEYVPSRKDPNKPVEIKKRKTIDFGLEYEYSKTAKPSNTVGTSSPSCKTKAGVAAWGDATAVRVQLLP
jgi:hypothetical protein